MLPDGLCCDGYRSSDTCNSCDNIFAICASDVNSRPCSICDYRTINAISREYVIFTDRLYIEPYGDPVSNPLQFTFGKWNVSDTYNKYQNRFAVSNLIRISHNKSR